MTGVHDKFISLGGTCGMAGLPEDVEAASSVETAQPHGGDQRSKLGLKELRAGIVCVNDLSRRRKPKSEEKHPKLLADRQYNARQ